MAEFSSYIGLDVHKETIAVAIADNDGGAVRYQGEIPNTPAAVRRLSERLGRNGSALQFCYEAGPCGYELYRQLIAAGHACAVVAPALIPRKPGERIKTDRRDAVNLARLDRAGELTAVLGSRPRAGSDARSQPRPRGHEDRRPAAAATAQRLSAAPRTALSRQKGLVAALLALA